MPDITNGLAPDKIVVAKAYEQVSEGEKVRYTLAPPQTLQARRRKLAPSN